MTKGLWRDEQRFIDTYWSRFPGVWVHGDWASYDERGEWFLHGRSDDTLNIGGQRLGPAEAEAALTALPRSPTRPRSRCRTRSRARRCGASCVAAGDREPDPAELADAVAAALGKPFRPERVLLVADLPRTRSQKILRRVVRAVADGEDPGDLSSLENPAAIEAGRRGGEPVNGASMNGAAADGSAEGDLRRRRDVHRRGRRRGRRTAGDRQGADHAAAARRRAARRDRRRPRASSASGSARPSPRTDLFVYATTQATNAVLEGKTARTALLCTAGFPDVLVRREGGSMHPYDFSRPYPEPYVPRRLTFEVAERIGSEGEVVEALDEQAAARHRRRPRDRAGRGGRGGRSCGRSPIRSTSWRSAS